MRFGCNTSLPLWEFCYHRVFHNPNNALRGRKYRFELVSVLIFLLEPVWWLSMCKSMVYEQAQCVLCWFSALRVFLLNNFAITRCFTGRIMLPVSQNRHSRAPQLSFWANNPTDAVPRVNPCSMNKRGTFDVICMQYKSSRLIISPTEDVSQSKR